MTSIFPFVIPFDVDSITWDKITSQIEKTNNNCVHDYAKVYNLNSMNEINNEETRHNSWKNEFDDKILRQILCVNIIPIIEQKLQSEHKNKIFYVSLGDQKLDYIVYTNGGFFDVHHDFVAIQSEGMCQYTCLIGLSDMSNEEIASCGGLTTVYTPIVNNEEFLEITKSDIKCKLFHKNGEPIGIPRQYNCFQKGNGLMFKSELYHAGELYTGTTTIKELLMFTINIVGIEITSDLKNTENLQIKTIDNKIYVVPFLFLKNTVFPNMALFCNSNKLEIEMNSNEFEALLKFIASGMYTNNEEIDELIQNYSCMHYLLNECNVPKNHHKKIHDWHSSKNRFINFDKFEPFMISFAKEYDLIPFQIILVKSSLNNDYTLKKFVTYFNFDNDIKNECEFDGNIMFCMIKCLQNIYKSEKKQVEAYMQNVEYEVKSHIFDNKSIDSNLRFEFTKINNLIETKKRIEEYEKQIEFDQNFIFKRAENINGTILEEDWCNDSTYHYYANTTLYFSCKIDIKFCFVKNE